MKTIRVGLIGTGFMGQAHARAFRSVGLYFDLPARVELTTLCDIDPEQLKKCSTSWGFSKYTVRWEELVQDPSIDLVAITSPNALHPAMAIAAAQAGKAIYCEKPLAPSLSQSREMLTAVQKGRVATLVGYNYLHNPAIIHAKKMIADGQLGDLHTIRIVYDEDYLANPQTPHSWRCQKKTAGAGTLADLACHGVSIATSFLGAVDAVSGLIDTHIDQRPTTTGEMQPVENEDITHALLRFRTGATGILSSSRLTWGRKNYLAWEVHGTRGTLTFNQERMNELCWYDASDSKETQGFRTILTNSSHPPYDRFCPAPGHGLGFNDLKTLEVAHLLTHLIEDPLKLYPNFADAFHIEQIIHGVIDSSQQGSWVEIDSDGD